MNKWEFLISNRWEECQVKNLFFKSVYGVSCYINLDKETFSLVPHPIYERKDVENIEKAYEYTNYINKELKNYDY